MSVKKVKEYLASVGSENKVIEFVADTATVAQAAAALGCEEQRIAKTISCKLSSGPILIVAAGDGKIDNRRFKDEFSEKATMIPYDEVEALVGHAPGGVCPFAVNEGVRVFADESLKRFEYFFPAAGSSHSAIKMTANELCKYGNVEKWIDVCKGWREDEKQ